jgi:small subunit ribosomal protein S6
MASAPKLYDLMLLMRTDADDGVRQEILDGVRAQIEDGGGEIVVDDDWGIRALTYPIAHRADADYHLFQLHGPAELLESLRHTLRITDGVARFRIVKVLPGTPPPPEVRREPVEA